MHISMRDVTKCEDIQAKVKESTPSEVKIWSRVHLRMSAEASVQRRRGTLV